MKKTVDKVPIILSFIEELWQKKKSEYEDKGLNNKFACFFGSEVVDTSVGGNLSPLYFCDDDDLIKFLQEAIRGKE